MDKNDLKSVWHEIHAKNQDYPKINIGEIDGAKHSKIISKVLADQKLNTLLYSLFLALYICLMIYAFIYLGIHLSAKSLIPLFLAGLFIFVKTTSEIGRLIVLTKTADNMSVKESVLFFRKKLNRMKIIDFVVYLLFFYLFAMGVILIYLKDLGGTANLSWGNEMIPFLIILILLLLIIPWFIKYQHNQRYKKIYASLNGAADYLEEEL